MRTLIIWARVRDEWPCVHNDMHKHLATDGSISVTNFICLHPFCPSYCNESTIVRHTVLISMSTSSYALHTILISMSTSSYSYQDSCTHVALIYRGGKLLRLVAMERFQLANNYLLIWEVVLGIMVKRLIVLQRKYRTASSDFNFNITDK